MYVGNESYSFELDEFLAIAEAMQEFREKMV